jgi:xanthine dehydrogenase accessory factor
MLIHQDGSTSGTIGGGPVESQVINDALISMKNGTSGIFSYILDTSSDKNSLGMLCGGQMEVFINVSVSDRTLVIIGAGHVGLAVAKLADFSGLTVRIVDDRPELATAERFPMAKELHVNVNLLEAIASVPDDPSFSFLIATHSDDERALRAMLGRKWNYLGVLGSRRKIRILREKLLGEGFDSSNLKRMRAPVGLAIGGETPEEIAISIISELLADLNHESGGHHSEET